MKTVCDKAIEEFLRNDPRKAVAFSEGCIVNWFEKNYKRLGFDKIIKNQWNKTPDFIMKKGQKVVKVEIEYLSSSFLKHGHSPSDVDIVACCYKDTELKDVKVIDLNHIFVAYHVEIFPKIDIMNKHISSDELRSLVSSWEKKDEKKWKKLKN